MLRYAALPVCAGLVLVGSGWLLTTGWTFGGTAFADDPGQTPASGAVAKARNQDAISALKLYLKSHPSLARSHKTGKGLVADRRSALGATNGSKKPIGAGRNPHLRASGAGAKPATVAPDKAKVNVVQRAKSSGNFGIPSKADKQRRGQGDELLVPIDKSKRPRHKQSTKDTAAKPTAKQTVADADHLQLFVENRYPSANTCGVCHPKHYKEWSVSQHAYAQLSPVYLALNNRINQLSNGSNGDFCLRCHSPVGANLGESPFMSNLDRHPTSREGITCVVCHRINKAYNKASGRLALVEGGLTDPVFGPAGNKGMKATLAKPNKFRVVTKPKEPGRKIHSEAKLFQSIKTPVFCGTCHDVTLFNGFRLEEAYSEYRTSPAAAKGITCQDCHMGKIQGKPSGYDKGPAAIVGDAQTAPRKLTSHLFSGPDFSLLHPGIFPHNQRAAAFKTLREWLQFKHEAGWGTDKFESNIPQGYKFPRPWQAVDDRYDAREILNEQFKLLDFARIKRLEVMKNGFILGDVVAERADSSGLAFRAQVRNGTDGHNVPTGFTGERLIWLEVTVRDRNGTVVFRSGDRDPNGDLRDGHSSYVHAGKMQRDSQLFSLQSIFVTQNGRGGEIEHVIPIPFPTFALPRVLPSTTSLVFTGEPATERNHKKGIEPNGERWASYSVPASALTGQGPYEATVRLLAQPVPVNLLIASQKVGFDFGLTPAELGRKLVAGTQELWKKKLIMGIGARGASRLAPKGAWAPTLTPAPSTAAKKSSRKGEWKKGVFANE
ncbi:MAG: multiheme c-type cytochrome [Hyphomicrobiaceae bacterium]